MPIRLCTMPLLLAACAATASDTTRLRPTQWAQPVIGKGPDNWHQVATDLYRCSQPTAADMRVLVTFGIRSVCNLRQYHSDADEVAGTSLALHEVPLGARSLSYEDLVTALKTLLAAEKPVAVHCWHGSDRTGAVVAAWRIAVDGWTPRQAADEMTAGGFGFHQMFDNLRALVEGIDPERLRADVGLER